MHLGYIDTNVLIRYLTNDDPQKAAQSRTLIERLSKGNETVSTSEAVLAEIVHILSSKKLYNLPRHEIREHLERFLHLKGLKMRSKKQCLRALALYDTVHIDFVDCLIVAYAEQ